jgi:hypothetical protein
MEPDVSLLCLKQPFPSTHHEPDESNLHLCPVSVRSSLISSLYVHFFKMTSFPLVFSRNPVHFRFVVYATCPAQLVVLHLKFGQFILEYFLSVLTKNMDCSTVFCLLLIYSLESWVICCKGQDLLLRKTRSFCYFAHSVRSVRLSVLLEFHVDFPNTSVLFDSSEFLLHVIRASSKKNSFITVFCEHCTSISLFFSWFVYCSFTRCCRRGIFC